MFRFQVFEDVSAGSLLLFVFDGEEAAPCWAMSYSDFPSQMAGDIEFGESGSWHPAVDNVDEYGPYLDAAELVAHYNLICAAVDARDHADPQFWTMTYDNRGPINRDLWGPMMKEAFSTLR